MDIDVKYLKQCILLSRKSLEKGELPFGSLIVKGSKVLAESQNRVGRLNDVTAHAEIVAAKKAQKLLKTSSLSSCTIYASTEPCAMCSFIIRELKFKKVVFGAKSPIMGGYTRFKILQDEKLEEIKSFYSKPPKVIMGLLEKDATKVWDEWQELKSKKN